MRFSVSREWRKGARPYNQDRLGCWQTQEALLVAVADGMGGHAGGDLAAQAAVDSVASAFQAQARPTLADPRGFLQAALGQAHEAILRKAAKAGLGREPRTTLVCCVAQEGWAYWSHVGDSRLYLIREGRVAARTRDHTAVQRLIDAGRIREEAAATHPDRNRLLRCLGGTEAPGLEPVASAQLAKGDVVLLCSDGLWGPLTQRQLLMGFIGKDPARALAAVASLAEAHAGPGCDNITAVAVHWQEEFAAPARWSLEKTQPLPALP